MWRLMGSHTILRMKCEYQVTTAREIPKCSDKSSSASLFSDKSHIDYHESEPWRRVNKPATTAWTRYSLIFVYNKAVSSV
jgi:hypothetical protein